MILALASLLVSYTQLQQERMLQMGNLKAAHADPGLPNWFGYKQVDENPSPMPEKGFSAGPENQAASTSCTLACVRVCGLAPLRSIAGLRC
jgi:hypothetical protein